jgi:hypothetical protein
VAGLDDEGEARERRERKQKSKVGAAHQGAHYVYHRMPAPVVSAIAPSIMIASDSRIRIVFTVLPSPEVRNSLDLGFRRLGGLRVTEVPGFASPPRDGFAVSISGR